MIGTEDVRIKQDIMANKQKSKVPEELKSISATEDQLQQALARLLTRMPDVEDVQILQGAQEYGKDIVFRSKGALGESMPCAAVVKRDKITGSASSNSGARTVLIQIEQAFDTPFEDESGTEVFVERVYVMAPHPVGASALKSISGRLRSRKGQVVFATGHRLLSLFQKHWPDFLADEASALEAYAESMTEGLSNKRELSKLGLVYDVVLPEDQIPRVYVDIGFERHFSKHALSVLELVPTRDDLRRSIWMLKETDHLADRFQELTIVLKYLERCQLSSYSARRIETVRQHMTSFLEEYPSAWRRLAKKHHSDGEGKIVLPDSGQLPVGEDAKLEGLRADLAVMTKEALRLVQTEKKSYETTVAEMKREKVSGISLLESDRFQRALYMDSCLALMPHCDSSPIWSADFPPTLLDDWPNSVLITGPAGSGKTSFCRWNALRDIDAYLEGTSRRLPVYIALHHSKLSGRMTFSDLVGGGIAASTLLDDDAKSKGLKQGANLRVYLDGLDELSDESQRERVVSLVRKTVSRRKRTQCVITSRDYAVGPWLNWLPRVSLKSLQKKDFRQLAFRWLDGNDTKTKEFFKQLSSLSEIESMTWTPLLATLTIMVYKQTHRLPENRTRLYELFIDLLSGGWDLVKGIIRPSKYTRDWKIRVLAHLAYSVHRKGQRRFREGQLSKSAEWIGHSGGAAAAAVDELLRDAIVVREQKYLQFRHLSFQEYLAARHCVNQPKDDNVRFAADSLAEGNTWWRDVLRFYVGITGDVKGFKVWLTKYHLERLANTIGI